MVLTLAVISGAISVICFLSGIFAMWLDGRRHHHLQKCPVEYAAIALSTILSLVYVFAVADWILIPTDCIISEKRNVLFYAYNSIDRIVVLLFHAVLVARVVLGNERST